MNELSRGVFALDTCVIVRERAFPEDEGTSGAFTHPTVPRPCLFSRSALMCPTNLVGDTGHTASCTTG
jgi:hypothetical protein